MNQQVTGYRCAKCGQGGGRMVSGSKAYCYDCVPVENEERQRLEDCIESSRRRAYLAYLEYKEALAMAHYWQQKLKEMEAK